MNWFGQLWNTIFLNEDKVIAEALRLEESSPAAALEKLTWLVKARPNCKACRYQMGRVALKVDKKYVLFQSKENQ